GPQSNSFPRPRRITFVLLKLRHGAAVQGVGRDRGISTETSKACLASARDAVSRYMTGPHLGGQEYAIALTSDLAAAEFLGATVADQFRRLDERHPKRKTSTQRFFLTSLWMSSLCELRGALAQRRGDDAVAELDRSPCAGWCQASGNIKSGRPRWHREHSAG